MSHHPFEPAQPHDHWDGPAQPLEPAPEQPAPRSRARTFALVGGILGIVALAMAGAAFAYQKVGGGGPQPESVMPASVIAFAKVDLDPSGGQKIDAIRFARKFPQARTKVSEGSDLRQVIITSLQDQGELKGIDYHRDIEPWLGSRVGVGVLPGTGGATGSTGSTAGTPEPIPVIALAVSDKEAATASLPKVAESLHGQCRVLEDYALCTGAGTDLETVMTAASKGSLEKSATFARDMADLGEDGFAAAWADTGALARVSGSMLPLGALGVSGAQTPAVGGGRTAVALRFAGTSLELAGHVSDATAAFASSATKDSGVGGLPKGTLAAVGMAGAGEQFRSAWPAMETQLKATLGDAEFSSSMAQLEDTLGVRVPDDLAKALGSQLAVAFGGMGADRNDLRVAVVSNGDRAVLQKLADAAGPYLGAGRITLEPAGRRTVVSISEGYAATVAAGSGLGDTASFRDAVPDAGTARMTAYADIAGILAAFKDEIPADTARDLAPLSAFGASISGEGHDADFRVRLTTR